MCHGEPPKDGLREEAYSKFENYRPKQDTDGCWNKWINWSLQIVQPGPTAAPETGKQSQASLQGEPEASDFQHNDELNTQMLFYGILNYVLSG